MSPISPSRMCPPSLTRTRVCPKCWDQRFGAKFHPIVNNPNVVHHLLLYGCKSDKEVLAAAAFSEAPSEHGAMPCQTVKYAWAVGANDFCPPNDVGFVFDTEFPWHVLEIHYDNPSGLDGIVDDSGVAITMRHGDNAVNYVPAGFMWLAANMGKINIPAGKAHYDLETDCTLNTPDFRDGAEIPDEVGHGHFRSLFCPALGRCRLLFLFFFSVFSFCLFSTSTASLVSV